MPTMTKLSVSEHVPESTAAPEALVVLVHGSLDRSASFTRVLRRLDDLHTVVYDRRGYNHSREALPLNDSLGGHVDDLLAVIDGRPAVVVGHSYGGDVALGAALRHGEATSILAVAAYEPPMPWLEFWPKSPVAAGPPPPPVPDADGDDADGHTDADAAAAEQFFRRMVGDAAWDRLPEEAKAARRADGPALAAELRAIRLTEAPFDVAELTVPALFGRGELSSSRHRHSVAWLVEQTPGAELIEFPGANHGAHLTHPDAFAAMARLALARAGRPTGTSP
jgi:pimeloyl-ACP methyl ester carboxylesterase